MQYFSLTLLTAYFTWTGVALAQAPRLECRPESRLVGSLTATGRATFLVFSSGRIDTSSVAVSGVSGASDAGFASAARRHLAQCAFDSAAVARLPANTPISTQLAIRNPLINVYGVELPRDWAAEGDFTPAARVFQIKDVEEAPFPMACGPFDSGDTLAPKWHWRAITTAVQAIVGTDGRVEADHLLMRKRTTPEAERDIRRFLPTCTWLPARIGGQPVRVAVGQDIYLRVRWHQ